MIIVQAKKPYTFAMRPASARLRRVQMKLSPTSKHRYNAVYIRMQSNPSQLKKSIASISNAASSSAMFRA